MSRSDYIKLPILFWKYSGEHLIAHALGFEYELMGDDPAKLKKMFSEYLKKKLDDPFFSVPDLEDPVLLNLEISHRPSLKENNAFFPSSEKIQLHIPLVYGMGEHGHYDCFLPTLDTSFQSYHKNQITLLGEHYIRDMFQSFTPAKAYSHLLHSEPYLDEIRIRTKAGFGFRKRKVDAGMPPSLINNAEKLPYTKSIRQKISTLTNQAWEQGDNINAVINKLVREKASVILCGDPGVGKSSILYEAIRDIDRRKTHRITFWKTTPRQIIAGARYLGDWQETLETFIEDLTSVRGILWLDDFISLVTTGGDGPESSMASYLLPFLKDGGFQVIGEMTPQELDVAKRLLPGFTEHFQVITIRELEKSGILKIFQLYDEYVSKTYDASIDPDALTLSYSLLRRFVTYEKFPGKAITFLSSLVDEALNNQKREINQEDVINAFIAKTGLPEIILRDDVMINERELNHYFESRIMGQSDAVKHITSIIKVFKSGINDPEKPIASMIFAGPTGVGKTASVKLLSEYFFGHGQKSNPLIRLDMSEFQHPDQIYRLIGTGGSKPGKMIQFVRERPFSILLLDEIEKANPLIFDALMTVFDEGFLVDSHGRVTDFRNTIIIMTTNLGGQSKRSPGFGNNTGQDYRGAIRKFFRPEFFNRIDRVVIFNALSQQHIDSITVKELDDLKKREGFESRRIKLEFSEKIVRYISNTGFDPNYGARPLQRAIEKYITSPIAKYLLKNRKLTNCTLKIDSGDDGNIHISKYNGR